MKLHKDGMHLRGRDVIDMVAKRNEKVKEERCASVPHLELHCSATLEGITASDDEREIVGTKLRVRVGCVGVGVARRGKDRAALDSRLWESARWSGTRPTREVPIG